MSKQCLPQGDGIYGKTDLEATTRIDKVHESLEPLGSKEIPFKAL